jgi:hydroxyacylglutathione hydrolase
MIKLTESLYQIPGQEDMLPDAHTYLIGNPDSADLSLVDTGFVGKGSDRLTDLQRAGVDLAHLKRVIMTHTHLDHLGGFLQIVKELPDIELWVHIYEADPLEAGDERTVYGFEMLKAMTQSQCGLRDGAFKLKVTRRLEDNEELNLGGQAWKVLHVPGHSVGSIALYDEERSILIPGDVVYGDGAIGRFDLHGADGSQLSASLERLASLSVSMLLPGHNNIVRAVPAGYIGRTARLWAPYLR